MSDAIVLSDLVVHRGPRRVLHDLSFSVPAGSVMVLINGSANRDDRKFENGDSFDWSPGAGVPWMAHAPPSAL